MDDDRLKKADTCDYFDEWLARIRDIRASEKRFYQKIRDMVNAAYSVGREMPYSLTKSALTIPFANLFFISSI